MSRRIGVILFLCLFLFDINCANKTTKSDQEDPVPQNAAGLPQASAMVVIPPDSPQLSQFEIESVRVADLPEDEVVAPGRIEFDTNRVSRVLLPVSGRVDRVFVRLGDSVATGQSLFTIDSPEAEAAISEFRQSQASISQTLSTLSKAKADYERTVDLFEHKAIAKKEVQASENALALAQAGLDQAEAAREHGRRRLEILGLGEGEAGQKVNVRAPLSGKVIDLAITAGEYRNDTTTPVITVADLDTVWVISAVPENLIRLIDVGERVQVELVAYPNEIFDARVTRIADALDPKTRTVQVRAELANPRGKFKPEMFGRIRHSHSSRTVLVVPAQAILHRGHETVVYVERGPGKFERVPVNLGTALGNQVPVLTGIKPGDRIVVGGVMLLSGMEGR